MEQDGKQLSDRARRGDSKSSQDTVMTVGKEDSDSIVESGTGTVSVRKARNRANRMKPTFEGQQKTWRTHCEIRRKLGGLIARSEAEGNLADSLRDPKSHEADI